LDNGADPNGRSSDRQCALSFASAAGHLDIVRELISLGANPDIYNINGVTAIMRVKEGRSIEILEALIDAGTQIDFRDNLNRTALWHTVHNGWADGGRILLSAGADPDMAEDTSSGGLSPRKIAYERGQTGMSIVFVAHDNGVDVLTEKSKEEYLAETIDATGLTATELLHQPFADCVRMNNLDAVRFYLEVDVNPSQIYLNREANLLCLAAQEGHLDMVHELLEAGVDPNETDDEGWPPIFYAIEHWQAGTAQALIDGGYDVNYALEVPRIEEGWYDTNFWEYDWGMTALHLACKKPNGDIMRALIRAGADVNVFDWDDRTPLVYCSDAGSFDMVRDLVEAGADIDLEASWALLTAVRYEHAPIVRYLLEQGANPNIESTTRGNPLIVMAAMDGNSEIVNILIEFNTELDLSGRHGITALMYAAGRGYIDMVRALLDNGADYSLHSQDGATALAYARGHDQEEIINLLSEYMEQPIESGDHAPWSPVMDYTFADQILYNTEFNLDEWLDMGIDPDAVDDEGLPAIMVATIENKIELVQGLLDAGADPNATSPDGSTALMYAAAFDYPEIARILLDSGSNPNMVRDGDDSNALYLACDSGAVDIVRMLIDAGVIIDFVIGDQSDMDLTSPIYRASRNNYREIVVMLLEAGADPDAGFRQYRSPLINACGRGDAEMFELLIEAGADVNRHDHNGITPLIIASKFNFPVLVSRLIELGADVHVASDEYYQTALTAAAARNNTQVMGMLLDAGAGIEALDYENWTPLMFAISWGQEDAVRLLIDRGANVHAKDIYGRSTIDIANNAARWNIAQILRDASAS
ncbi:ankyrin repeat domain-containing protein, partial [bacterium]|nr:ankyrin repeat domain-containing protein [bacterium]